MMKKAWFLLVFILLFLINPLRSQNVKERELELRREWNQKSPKEIYKDFTDFYDTLDTLSMRITAEKLLKEAEYTENPEYYIMGYHRLSDYYRIREEYKKALTELNLAIGYLDLVPDFYNKVQLFNLSGTLNRLLGRYEKSLESLLINLKWAKENNDDLYELSTRIAIAKIKSLVYDPQEAIEICLENLQLIEKTENPLIKKFYDRFQRDLWITLIKAYISIKDYNNGKLYCNKLIEKGKQSNNKSTEALGILGLCDIYSLTREYDKAFLNLKIFEELENVANRNLFEPFIYLYYARIYFNAKKYENVFEELNKIEELKQRISFDSFVLQETYVLYAKTYQSYGNSEKSLAFYDKALNVHKNNAERKSKLSQNITERYNLVDFKKEIDLLSARSKTQKQFLWFLLGIFIIGLASGIIYFKKRKEKNKERFNILMSELNAYESKNNIINIDTEHEDLKTRLILKDLEKFEKELFFLNNSMTLHLLAQKLKTNTTYLSKIINQEKNLTFSKYITNLRIEYSLHKLRTDKKFRLYSIKALAKEVGFRSVTPFINAFKARTNLTPAFFIKELNKGS